MKIIAKVSAVLVLAAMTVFAFGCGSSASSQGSSPGSDAQDIQVNDIGFNITDEGKLRYAFIASNPNDGFVVEDVVFTIEAYDINGAMIAGGGETISALYPGVETPGCGEIELFSRTTDTPRVENLSIVPMMDTATWKKTNVGKDELDSSVKIVDARMSDEDNGSVKIRASIRYAEGDDLKIDPTKMKDFRAVAMLFDEGGKAVCGTEPVTFVLDSAGASYGFDETIINPPAYSDCFLYVTPV